MSKEICISSTPHETRLAILEDEQLTEVYYERENEYTLAGSIYKGRVTRVLPGMQSAFVDLGLERDAFLYVTDFMEEQEDSSDFERIPANGEETGRGNQGRENRGKDNQNREASQPRAAHTAAEEEPAPRRTAPANGSPGGQAPGGEFEDGTRRWRGRRGRRKGFRPSQGGQQGAPEERQPGPSGGFPAGHATRFFEADPYPAAASPVAFSLPGESLSKYGGQSAARTPTPAGRSPAHAAAGQCHPDQALDADRDTARMERRRPAPGRVHLPLSRVRSRSPDSSSQRAGGFHQCAGDRACFAPGALEPPRRSRPRPMSFPCSMKRGRMKR